MAKKILVVDTDGWTNCLECPAFNITGAGIRTCQASKNGYCESRRIYTKSKIPEWCPLKEMPEQISSEHRGGTITEDYANGFNDCLALIIRTED